MVNIVHMDRVIKVVVDRVIMVVADKDKVNLIDSLKEFINQQISYISYMEFNYFTLGITIRPYSYSCIMDYFKFNLHYYY